MGICNSSNNNGAQATGEENAKNKKIEDELIKQQSSDSQIIKLLLLGAGESGKSTLFKALRSLYGEGFTEESLAEFIEPISTNTISAMIALCENVDNYGTLESEAQVSRTYLTSLQNDNEMTPEIAGHIKKLWADPAIQKAFQNSAEFQLVDSAPYFFSRIDAIAKPGYIPTEQDVLRSRVRTTGIVESSFSIDGNLFKLFDVGGQRNERKKWIHCFDNVSAVIFVVGISAYDQVLFEDEKTNRMHEALKLFDETSNSKYFEEISMILFLNKMDLFVEKIKNVPLKGTFPEYDGPEGDSDHAKDYIKNQFIAKNKNEGRTIITYFTTATDTDIISAVFKAVKDIIISTSLKDAGLY